MIAYLTILAVGFEVFAFEAGVVVVKLVVAVASSRQVPEAIGGGLQ
jgi:hypothetical protein